MFWWLTEKKKKADPTAEPPRDPEVEFLGKAPKKKDNRTTYLRKSIILNIIINKRLIISYKYDLTFEFVIIIDPPLPKPGKKFDKEDKKENEMVRSY